MNDTPHWSTFPRAVWLYANSPAHRRLYDAMDGFGPPLPPITEADLVRIRACPHHTPCPIETCLQARCALGKGRGGEVDPYDCLECLDATEEPCG